MENKLQKSVRTYSTKIILTIILGFLILLIFVLSSSFKLTMELKQEAVSSKLLAITKILASEINSNELDHILKKYQSKDDIKTKEQDELYKRIHLKLKNAREINNLGTAIYTLTREKSNSDKFFFGVTSDENPYFRHPYESDNDSYKKFYETGGIIGIYEDIHGKWVSAFSPVKSNGRVIAIIQADKKFDSFIEKVKKTFLSYILIFLLIMVFVLSAVIFFIRKNFHKGVLEYGEIFESMEKEKKSNEIKSEFVSMVSHEMRTPMNGVIGMTDILLDSKVNDEQKEQLSIIKNSANSLLVILNDILDFSKIEANKLNIEQISFNFREMLEQLFHLYKHEIKKKNLKFETHISKNIFEIIESDSVRIKQVLGNFINNAIKFTSTGSIYVNIYAKEITEDSMNVYFEVVDQGIGIPKDKLDILFTPFTQVDSSTTREYGGSGMGLAICKKITELMKGTIGVESDFNKGATFWFEIPVKKGQNIIKHNNEELPSSFSKDFKILIAEDSLINQKVISKMMEKLGLHHSIASNGKEAIEKFEKDDFDLILMDIQMPELNGIEATKKIRKNHTKIPIIALTASATVEDKENCLRSGMSDYISKPIDFEKLKSILAKWS